MTEEHTLENPTLFTLRTVNADDVAFLQEVYASTRADELTQLPWNEAQRSAFIRMQFTAQRQHYLKHYPNARQDLVLVDEQPIGRLYVNRGSRIHVIDMERPGISTPGLGHGVTAFSERRGTCA